MQDSEDESEQVLVAAQAHILMDCAADMVRQHGLEAFEQMQDVHLHSHGARLERSFSVTGRLPDEQGGGMLPALDRHGSLQSLRARHDPMKCKAQEPCKGLQRLTAKPSAGQCCQ